MQPQTFWKTAAARIRALEGGLGTCSVMPARISQLQSRTRLFLATCARVRELYSVARHVGPTKFEDEDSIRKCLCVLRVMLS